MTAQHPDILTVRDAEILRRLRRVVEAGAYYRSYTADDVTRVANRWLTASQAPVAYLRPVPTPDGAVTVILPKGQAEAVRVLANNPHATNYDIGVLLGISTDAAKDRLLRAYRLMRAHSRNEAVQLINSGKVRIVDRERYGRGDRHV